MAYETLVAPELTPELVRAGANLIQSLDAAKVRTTAALWLYHPEEGGWRLVLASPEVDLWGSKKFYEKVFGLLNTLGDSPISRSYLSVVGATDPLVMLLKSAITTGPGLAAIRFTRNVINGVLIHDALIYRVS